MKELLKSNAEFEHSTMSIDEALAYFADQPYKVELIQDLARGKVDEMGEPHHRAGRDGRHLPPARVRRPVPRAARPGHAGDQGQRHQAAAHRWRLLAR